jgi:hypothetical protein
VATATVDSKGLLSALIVQDVSAGSYAVLPANNVSAWSTGETVSFLSDDALLPAPNITSVDGNWLTPDVQGSLAKYTDSSGAFLDMRAIVDQGIDLPFESIGIASPESWLDLR